MNVYCDPPLIYFIANDKANSDLPRQSNPECSIAKRMQSVLLAIIVSTAAATFNSTALNSTRVDHSDGCTSLQNGGNADEAITKISLMCAMRTTIAHCGLEFETQSGKYALAYNSKTIAGPINTEGQVWCQEGGMPMKNPLANGGCAGCGGWLIAGTSAGRPDTATGSFKALKDFMNDVKQFGDERPYYNIAACETRAHNEANCQLTATQLYRKLTGQRAYHCPACDLDCF